MYFLDTQLHKLQKPAIARLNEVGIAGCGCLIGSKLFLVTANRDWQAALRGQHKNILTAISRFQENTGGKITHVYWSYPFVRESSGYQQMEFEVR